MRWAELTAGLLSSGLSTATQVCQAVAIVTELALLDYITLPCIRRILATAALVAAIDRFLVLYHSMSVTYIFYWALILCLLNFRFSIFVLTQFCLSNCA